MPARKFFFALVVLLTASLALVPVVALRYPAMAYYDGEYPAWMEEKDALRAPDAAAAAPAVLFLGDSVMKASVMPEVLGTGAVNLALGGGTPIEMHYALTEYLGHHGAPRAVFVGFSPVHYTEAEQFDKRALYFHYLPWREGLTARLRMLSLDGVPWYLWGSLLAEDASYMLRLPTKYWRTMLGSGFARGEENRRVYDEVRAARGHMLFERVPDWTEKGFPYYTPGEPFSPLPSLDWYLRDLIRICRARGIEVHILRLPLEPLLADAYEESGYLAAVDAYLSRVAREEDATLEAAQRVYGAEVFGDSLHPNAEGARRYSRELLEEYREVFP